MNRNRVPNDPSAKKKKLNMLLDFFSDKQYADIKAKGKKDSHPPNDHSFSDKINSDKRSYDFNIYRTDCNRLPYFGIASTCPFTFR